MTLRHDEPIQHLLKLAQVDVDTWYAALSMLVSRLINEHLPVSTVKNLLYEVTSDVAVDFEPRLTDPVYRELDPLVRLLLTDLRKAAKERAEREFPIGVPGYDGTR
jgi:hypothetical protein